MRLERTFIAAFCCLWLKFQDHVVGAFVPSTVSSKTRRSVLSPLAMSDSPMRDIVSRIQQQKQQQQQLNEIEYPKLFSDDLLEDMREVLLLLEKRVKEGPGALTAGQVQDVSTRSQRILVDMKTSTPSNVRVASKETRTQAATPPPPPPKQQSRPVTTATTTAGTRKDSDTEDGPGYTPDGGFGSLARGTTNTYVIPGMDAMTPEEYMQALQQSIIDRQTRRKTEGSYGNLAAHDYLGTLGSKSGMLK